MSTKIICDGCDKVIEDQRDRTILTATFNTLGTTSAARTSSYDLCPRCAERVKTGLGIIVEQRP